MAYAGRFIRASLSAITSPSLPLSHPRITFYGKIEPLKTWIKGIEPVLNNRASRFYCKLNIQRKCMQNFCLPGSKLSMGSIFGVSVLFGSVNLWPHVAYAMDGLDVLVDDRDVGASDLEEGPRTFWAFASKFLLPVFLFVTLLMNWDHPIILATKVFLILLSTKPSPLSVYLFVEQLRRQSMRRGPLLNKLKSSYANKVEVEDYKLLCLARVELRDQKFTLIGILGSWWVLPSSSPCQRAFSAFRNRALKNY